MQDIRLRTGRPVLLLEVVKPTPAATSEDVGALAAQVATSLLALWHVPIHDSRWGTHATAC